MRKGILGLVAVLCYGLLVAGGCAKKEIVKAEEPVAPAAAAQPVAPPPTPTAPPVKEEAVKEPQAKEAAPKVETAKEPMKEEAAASLQTINFDFDSFVLTLPARDILSRNAETLLKKIPSSKVTLEGHCDERGSDEYNLALGEKRAKAAQSFLVTLGVPAERLSIISYGKEKPLESGHDETAWAKNRRVEFNIVK